MSNIMVRIHSLGSNRSENNRKKKQYKKFKKRNDVTKNMENKKLNHGLTKIRNKIKKPTRCCACVLNICVTRGRWCSEAGRGNEQRDEGQREKSFSHPHIEQYTSTNCLPISVHTKLHLFIYFFLPMLVYWAPAVASWLLWRSEWSWKVNSEVAQTPPYTVNITACICNIR